MASLCVCLPSCTHPYVCTCMCMTHQGRRQKMMASVLLLGTGAGRQGWRERRRLTCHSPPSHTVWICLPQALLSQRNIYVTGNINSKTKAFLASNAPEASPDSRPLSPPGGVRLGTVRSWVVTDHWACPSTAVSPPPPASSHGDMGRASHW